MHLLSQPQLRPRFFFMSVVCLALFLPQSVTSAAQPQSSRNDRESSSAGATGGAAASNSTPVDLSGFWERRDESGAGSLGSMSSLIPAAEITPEAKKFDQETKARLDAGYVVRFDSRYCQNHGMPFLMEQSPPIDIVQSGDEMLIMSEQATATRHIYLDGRGHADPATYEPSTNGDSIGHWEGDTLVVDTIGFNELGNRSVPGGGMRSKTSHLVERLHLFENGKRLSITATWTDPHVYVKPHTYEIRYFKDPPDTYAFEDFCDAGDPAQGQSVQPVNVPAPKPQQ